MVTEDAGQTQYFSIKHQASHWVHSPPFAKSTGRYYSQVNDFKSFIKELSVSIGRLAGVVNSRVDYLFRRAIIVVCYSLMWQKSQWRYRRSRLSPWIGDLTVTK